MIGITNINYIEQTGYTDKCNRVNLIPPVQPIIKVEEDKKRKPLWVLKNKERVESRVLKDFRGIDFETDKGESIDIYI